MPFTKSLKSFRRSILRPHCQDQCAMERLLLDSNVGKIGKPWIFSLRYNQ